ncbi:MAG: acetate--CoA ligase family protein, partial [Burkholderiales bacterium]
MDLKAALAPRSIAVVGASDNPEKIGGRPIKYMLRYGYRGRLYPVNPGRAEVQGLKAYPDVAALPEAPDLAIVAVPGAAAVDAVADCAARGTGVAVVMSSGFGETGEAGRRAQDEMLRSARATGMRIVGPNTQGVANFGNSAIASFATLIGEVEPKDGPVAIVSQSGAMSVVPYAFLRGRGLGVRHAHATGNESDLTVADFAAAVALDPEVKLILLYLESIPDPARLAAAAELARARGIPVVALKAGVSERGRAAAASHTGALATEDRVVDAFFEQHGIWRVPDMRTLCNAAELYLQGWRPAGRRLVAISNSGASCVMAADAAERHGLDMPAFDAGTQSALRAVLPGFASSANPIDLTAALLGDSGLLGAVLPVIAERDAADAYFISLPMSGRGYDVPRFARDAAGFARRTGKPVVVASPLESTRAVFRAEGLATFEHDVDAVAALGQLAQHEAIRAAAPQARGDGARVSLPPGDAQFLSEAQSLALLAQAGVPVVAHRVCRTAHDAAAAFLALGGPVAVKGCSPDVPHKTEHGLVRLGCASAEDAADACAGMLRTLEALGARDASVIVAKMQRTR